MYGQKPVKFLEKTSAQHYQQFKLENHAVIIGQTSFQNLQKCKVEISSTETGVLLNRAC